MSSGYTVFSVKDNWGRRSGIDRRRFSYSDHVPERRIGVERRSGEERRSSEDRRCNQERRQETFLIDFRDRRIGMDRRFGTDRRDFMVL